MEVRWATLDALSADGKDRILYIDSLIREANPGRFRRPVIGNQLREGGRRA